MRFRDVQFHTEKKHGYLENTAVTSDKYCQQRGAFEEFDGNLCDDHILLDLGNTNDYYSFTMPQFVTLLNPSQKVDTGFRRDFTP